VQSPAAELRSPFPPFELLSTDQVEAIHQASLQVLEEIGVNFLLDEAREILGAAGADVAADGPRVRFDRDLIETAVSRAPSSFVMHGRDAVYDRTIGGDHLSFCLVSSPPNATDLTRGRRPGNFEDYCDFLRLGQSLNIAHFFSGYPVEPTDVPTPIRHLKAEHAMATLGSKNLSGYALGRRRILDSIEIARLARGIDHEQLLAEPSLWTVVNANSPLQYDKPMLLSTIEMARHRQPVIVTPFTLAGAMAPVTVAGALVQQNAEALAGIAFMQIVNPGAPVIYGGFTSNVDMKTGAPAFGTPEYAKAVLAGGQLARRYGLPYRSSNVNASNAPDEQAVYESEMSIWACMLAHCNCVKHALGWLEGGLSASFEKVILDAEMLQMAAAFLEPLAFDEDSLGLDAIREVGPGGHFFGAQHTLARYETAFYRPLVSDWRNFETWSEDGAKTATMRAHEIYQALLADYEPPPMEPDVREALDDFVERRIAEGGAVPEE
jgi:trimethylamine--corrinoid protein Co-methyltransferase